MKFDLYKNGYKISFGNPRMLKTYTNQEIKDFYKRFNVEVDIRRS